ncbi:non-hydrolyzing UDP-N-acetylglucosamine 2-epimerase [Methylocella sp.]|uniref:non-hydrolyzing UDP-N-acetylglucosamine 2-epimerase n=1 Tax=Methylocella sp. TaxID=1978226 RepID=UPI0037850350
MKIICIFGTRPEAIKMAPVVEALRREPSLETLVCVTGQHREMLQQVLDLFDLKPDVDLDVMRPNQTLNGLFSRVMTGVDAALERLGADRVLVHGDTTTALAAALAAFHRRVPVGHVEAGLRTYDIAQPWPEEMNRRGVDVVCDLLFAPTALSAENLAGERLEGRVVVTGNTVIDALKETVARVDADPAARARLDARFAFLGKGRRLLLVTGHRRENFGLGFDEVCAALAELSLRPDLEIVYPVHRNPNVQDPVLSQLSGRDNIHLIEPLSYQPFVELMRRAHVVLTDSGGVQEEAPSLGKPVLVMRDVTERPEAVAAGTVRLVGARRKAIVASVAELWDDAGAYARFARSVNPYGDGAASARIAAALAGRPFEPFDPTRPAGATQRKLSP